MAATSSPAKAQPDRKTICLGDMHEATIAALKSKRARNLSALVRDALRVYLRGDRQSVDVRPIVSSLDKLRSDLARIGSNLNQLAHGFNMHGPAGFNRDALAGAHEDLRAEFRQIANQLNALDRELRTRARG